MPQGPQQQQLAAMEEIVIKSPNFLIEIPRLEKKNRFHRKAGEKSKIIGGRLCGICLCVRQDC